MKPAVRGEKERLFTLILTSHRRWGPVLMPYIIERLPGMAYYRMAEALSPHPDNDTLSHLDHEESELVRLINDYSDRALYRIFSKHLNSREFIEKVTDKEVDTLIRPYIEERVYQCLHISRREEVPVYLQKPKINTLHEEDRLFFDPQPAIPVFRFERGPEGSEYSLTIECGGIILDFRKGNVDQITNKPCIIRSGDRLLFVSDIDGTKLKPFFSRAVISIPKASEKKYFGTFVLSVISDQRVTGSGFTIRKTDPVRKAHLTIEKGIRGMPVAILRFSYDGRYVYSTDEIIHLTTFETVGDDFLFLRRDRDSEWEKSCIRILGEAGLFAEDGINFTVAGTQEESVPALRELITSVANNRDLLHDAGFIISTGSLDDNYSLEPVTITVNQEIVNDWFDVKAVVSVGSYTIPFTRLRKNILDGVREYRLPDGSIAILPEEWFTRFRGLFEMGQDENGSLRVHKQHFGIIIEALSSQECEICDKLEKLVMPGKIPVLQPPRGLNAELRTYQAEGLSWLHFLQMNGLGGCLADDMGLGKTLQALALLQWNKENNTSDKPRLTSVVVVPASLVHNWNNEIRKFSPALKTLIHQGQSRVKSALHFSRYDIILSSYHTVRQDIDFLKDFRFHYAILDESQHIKNPSSGIYRAAVRLNAAHRLVLTGTPIENSLTDMWTQLSFVNPGLLGSLTFFRREFARPIEKGRVIQREQQLRKIIQPFIMRRSKEMVAADLPPVTEQIVYCDMAEEQASLYEKEKSAVRNSILENIESMGIEKSAIMVLQGIMRLRQIANHPALTNEAYNGDSGKFDTVTYNIESVISEGHKILVFSSFVKHLELFVPWLSRNGIGYSMLTGATRDREKVIDSFRNDERIRVFLISLKAGGVGLNLSEADYVFILDPWWNPASELQALSRAHRIGQNKKVFVYRYISGETIEEKIQHLQERKSKLAESFIESNMYAGFLNIRDILEIIN